MVTRNPNITKQGEPYSLYKKRYGAFRLSVLAVETPDTGFHVLVKVISIQTKKKIYESGWVDEDEYLIELIRAIKFIVEKQDEINEGVG